MEKEKSRNSEEKDLILEEILSGTALPGGGGEEDETPLHWIQLLQATESAGGNSGDNFEDFLQLTDQKSHFVLKSDDYQSRSNSNGNRGDEDKCSCTSCMDHSVLVQEIADEMQKMREYWINLKQDVKTVYSLVLEGNWPACQPDLEKMRMSVHVLANRDPHQLFNRLEALVRSTVLDIRDQLYSLLTKEAKNPQLAQEFIVHLLEGHTNIVEAARILAPVLHDLEVQHLRRFSLTWELFNKHMYQKLVYSDAVFQNNIPIFISQLRAQNPISKQQEERVTELVRGYLDFDVEMENVAVFWSGSKALLREYTVEQERIKERRQSLKSDYHRFKEEQKKNRNNIENFGLLEERILEPEAESPLSLLLSLDQLGADALPEEISSVLSALPDLGFKDDEAYSSFGDFGSLRFEGDYSVPLSPSTPGGDTMPIGLSPAEEMAFSTIINHFISEGWDLETDEEFEPEENSFKEDETCFSPPQSRRKGKGEEGFIFTPSPSPSPRESHPPSQIGKPSLQAKQTSSSHLQKSLSRNSVNLELNNRKNAAATTNRRSLPPETLKLSPQDANAKKVADFLSNLRGNDESERNAATSAHIDRSELESDALVMRGDDLTASKKIGPLQNEKDDSGGTSVRRSSSVRQTQNKLFQQGEVVKSKSAIQINHQLNKPKINIEQIPENSSAAPQRPTELKLKPNTRPTNLNLGPAARPTQLNLGQAARPQQLNLGPPDYKITKSQSADQVSHTKDVTKGCANKKEDGSTCMCKYCQVFGTGAGSVSPVSPSRAYPPSRNFPDIRDRLRYRLDLKKKRSSSTQLSGSSSELAAAAADDLAKNENSSGTADVQLGETGSHGGCEDQGSDLPATPTHTHLPATHTHLPAIHTHTHTHLPAKVAKVNYSSERKDSIQQERNISDVRCPPPSSISPKDVEVILEYIEGRGCAAANKKLDNQKKRQKKERQRLQRLQEEKCKKLSNDNINNNNKQITKNIDNQYQDCKENFDCVEMEQVNLSITDVDEIFTPKLTSNSSQNMDDADRELEEFKEFCQNSIPAKNRAKIVLDMKNILAFKRKNL